MKTSDTKINKILEKKKEEIIEAKTLRPINILKKIITENQNIACQNKREDDRNFLESLKSNKNDTDTISKTKIIAEIKSASPSNGVLRKDLVPKKIAETYQKHNVSAISVLTVKYGFNGNIAYLQDVKRVTNIPILRKDFIIEEYQIYESKAFEADAILLIASILEKAQLKEYLGLTMELGMNALIEVHAFEDLEKAIECNSEIIGINNRNLKTFDVDINTTLNLIKEIPRNKTIVSESGIKTRNDIEFLESNGVNAFLIGTTLMESKNIGVELDKLLGKTV